MNDGMKRSGQAEYSEDQMESFKKQFAERQRQRWIAAAGGLLAVIVLLKGKDAGWISSVVVVLVTLIVTGWMVLAGIRWKCPACDEPLGTEELNPRYCSKCGAPLA